MRPDRVLYPSGFTKNDAVTYYRAVAKWLLPHLRGRPVSFLRFPDTVSGQSFWEKDAPSFTPKWVKTVAVPRRSGESEIHYIVVDDVKTLAWIADIGGIELHPFLHKKTSLERATSMLFDLDPGEGASLDECREVALILRDALERIGLRAWAKVSGSKGLQVYVPLNGTATHAAAEAFAQTVAVALARAHPALIVAKMAKQFRARKVFIDYSQNADFKTTVSVYSLRAKRDRPYVSMPVSWEEVERGGDLEFEPKEAMARLKKRGDLFAPVLRVKQELPIEAATPATRSLADARDDTVRGIRLPRARSQSGRRLFVLSKVDGGDELWLDMQGKFRRWILRPGLTAMPAGEFAIEKEYRRGEVPPQWRKRVSITDIGSYELIEGSFARHHFDLWFTGHELAGEWMLAKVDEGAWRLAPVQP
jgi:bifunctional non-homologous end joining protein LigD